jgi:cyclopropane fatty-acyl-phospholipid synthase-like methyltransferase
MLAQARALGTAIVLHQIRLQDLPYDGEFDAILTIDAMEHIPPEDWPLVLANLHRAARPGALVYLTVEEVAESVIEDAFATLTQRGLPAVRGEVIVGNVGGNHYYPGRDQVTAWLTAAGLRILDEGYQQEDGWGYRHFLLHTAGHRTGPPPADPVADPPYAPHSPSAARARGRLPVIPHHRSSS